jgi:rSAM/selenodomain-associated transferase 1
MRPVIILFAKAPVPGRVKTRLIPRLSAASAAALHAAFVWDLIERLQPIRRIADLELHTDVETDAWSAASVVQRLQCEGDLGLKMLQALRLALSQTRPRAMIAGSDTPTVPLAHLEHLLLSASDVALGPAEDGGFYAVSCRQVNPRMFDNVEWSGPRALPQTVAAVEASGLSVELGAPWWDVDTAADLDRLIATDELPRHTAEFLHEVLHQEGIL